MNRRDFKQFTGETGYKLTEKDGKPYYGGSLDLRGTGITSLPEGLAVGGSLDLRGTGITSLPEGLAVGGSLDLEGTGITSHNVNKKLSIDAIRKIRNVTDSPKFWEWNGRHYMKVDNMFTILEAHKGNVYHVRKIESTERLYVITDGENHFAHGSTLKEAKADLIFKISDRDVSSYKGMSPDDILSFEEAIAAYRTITGSCAAGTRDYVENRLPKPHKKSYTIREIIQLTKGEYRSDVFAKFFEQ